MLKKILISSIALGVFGLMAFVLAENGKVGYTNSPGEGNCTSCHTGTINSGPGSISITSTPSLASGYVPGTTYSVTCNVSESSTTNSHLFGFGFEALLASGANGGNLAITNATRTKLQTKTVGSNVRNNVVHTGASNTGPNTVPFTFNWTAPAAGSGTVTFYTCGIAANASGDESGDHAYKTSLSVPENTTSVSEIAENDDRLSVYPNPASEKLNIQYKLNSASKVKIRIFNLNGQEISVFSSKKENEGTHSLNYNLEKSKSLKGTCFLEIVTDEYSKVCKLVIE